MNTASATFKVLKWTYKVLRSIVFSAVIVFALSFTMLYVGLALPPVQNYIRLNAQNELENFLGSPVRIGELNVIPANEIIIKEAVFTDTQGKECLKVGRLGAGINLWKLIFGGHIEISYVELLDFTASIYQVSPESPLNINYIIKAFSQKDNEKSPTKFNLKIHNIVIRNGKVDFDRLWNEPHGKGEFDLNHISISNFSADVAIPTISNDISEIDLRRLSFIDKSGLQLKDLKGFFNLTSQKMEVKGFSLRFPETELNMEPFIIPYNFFNGKLSPEQKINLVIKESKITPSNFASFYAPLSSFDNPLPFEASVSADINTIIIKNLSLGESGIELGVKSSITNYRDIDHIDVSVEHFNFNISSQQAASLIALANKNVDSNLQNIIPELGNLQIYATGHYEGDSKKISLNTEITANPGSMQLTGDGIIKERYIKGNFSTSIPSLEIHRIIQSSPIQYVSEAEIEIAANVDIKNITSSSGMVNLKIGEIDILNRKISNISGYGEKNGELLDVAIEVHDLNLDGNLEASAILRGPDSKWELKANVNDFDTYSSLIADTRETGYGIKGLITAEATGNNPDNLTGELKLSDFSFTKWNGKKLKIDSLLLSVREDEQGIKNIDIRSELFRFNLTGKYILTRIPGMFKKTLAEISPAIFSPFEGASDCGAGQIEISVIDAQPFIDFFDIPVFPLTKLDVYGSFDSDTDCLEIDTEIPFIQQGENNLITGTYLRAIATGTSGEMSLSAGTVYPTKKGLLKLDLDLNGKNGIYDVWIDFNKGRNVSFFGDLNVELIIGKDEGGKDLTICAKWKPSLLQLNNTEWKVEESEINYHKGFLAVDNFCIRHDDQYVIITGYNGEDDKGTLKVLLSEINMDYIFDTLNINHVTFGGEATGEIIARDIFGKNPEIRTKQLFAKDFSYNSSYMGDADLKAFLDMHEKKISIGAIIKENDRVTAEAEGGVWFGRDSLSFAFNADKVNIGFMQPFMSAFSSDIKGRASGEALLYGTFSDIDMTGQLVADSIDIMIDYINTRYHGGGDTIYLKPGLIEIPHINVHDPLEHSASVSGILTHTFFHEPVFNFLISDMDNLLVYNTNARINPLWYGMVFASGSGEITGRPGVVRITADVQTGEGSDFTFVLSDQQEAVKSNFLTFTDRRKAAANAAVPKDTIPDFLLKFHKNKKIQEEQNSDIFVMDFRVSVTDDVRFNLIMDPVAGDKITAYGEGAMTLSYSSLTDELRLYGKYVLDKGTYNFSLQDIILKEFIIKPGSSIAFTGDPYNGVLDITAAYRVNTSLTELDQSFANDRDLNRTSVPVEALLKVTGILTSPSIDFDIELPTVTEETSRKVKSIISTDDMMSRQVLYLVALNKFYPPEYMSTSNTGGEWASIASSTISSQIQNMIGQITDKFTLSPSIRSDKGDFSDIEVDLALSSQLFNNRLIINGNLGYRDPSNSSTTFVGDFDIEYLLNRKGSWRLKAYNHFNDQNYYLKSALTTQGLGIVWRKDFGLPRKQEGSDEEKTEEQTE